MKNDEGRAPSPTPENEKLASLRTKQEWHEKLARKHADSARRVWLRRILLEVDQERPKERAGARKKAGSRVWVGKCHAGGTSVLETLDDVVCATATAARYSYEATGETGTVYDAVRPRGEPWGE